VWMILLKKVDPRIKEVELRRDPVIIRVNKFDEDSAKDFKEQIISAHNTGQEVIPIVIDSYGGQVYSLMAMISAINSSHLPIATIVEGKAMSCGAVLLTFGADGMRYMDPSSTIMIHDVSSMSRGKVEEIKADSAETERLNKTVYEMMATNCGKKKRYFLDLIHSKGHADWYIDSKEAKKHDLINSTKIPSFEVQVGVKFSLV